MQMTRHITSKKFGTLIWEHRSSIWLLKLFVHVYMSSRFRVLFRQLPDNCKLCICHLCHLWSWNYTCTRSASVYAYNGHFYSLYKIFYTSAVTTSRWQSGPALRNFKPRCGNVRVIENKKDEGYLRVVRINIGLMQDERGKVRANWLATFFHGC